jgi:hypothetical protein
MALVASTLPQTQHASETLREAEANLEGAFNGVKAAEEAGASKHEVNDLTLKLNNALELLMNAERAIRAGDVEAAENYALKSMDLAAEVNMEAQKIRGNAQKSVLQNKVSAFSSAPVAALILAVAFHYSYKAWRKRDFNRLLRMEIREVKRRR